MSPISLDLSDDQRELQALARTFAARGYHGTSTRDIADRAGLSPAGVYVHFASKEDLFYRITLIGHQQTLRNAVQAAAAAGPGPAERLHALGYEASMYGRMPSGAAAQAFGQDADLGGFPRPFPAFESDEPAARHGSHIGRFAHGRKAPGAG